MNTSFHPVPASCHCFLPRLSRPNARVSRTLDPVRHDDEEMIDIFLLFAGRVKKDNENKDCQSKLRWLMKVPIEWIIG
jgi:hypothetical protein